MEYTKRYVSANELSELSFHLAHLVYMSGVRPTWLIALWRGGTPIGMCVQEYLKYHGIPTDHIAIRTSCYTAIGESNKKVSIHGTGYVVKNMNRDDVLLIVDDMFDKGRTILSVLEKLKSKMRANLPAKIYTATVFYKPMNNETVVVPDFYCEETSDWIVFDHELDGLTTDEIAKYKPTVAQLMAKCNLK